MVDVGNDAHVTDLNNSLVLRIAFRVDCTHICWPIHQCPDLVDGEVDHLDGVVGVTALEAG